MIGISNDYVHVGTDLELTCAISRIKPAAAEIYYMIDGTRYNGSDVETVWNDDGTLSQSKTFHDT